MTIIVVFLALTFHTPYSKEHVWPLHLCSIRSWLLYIMPIPSHLPLNWYKFIVTVIEICDL